MRESVGFDRTSMAWRYWVVRTGVRVFVPADGTILVSRPEDLCEDT